MVYQTKINTQSEYMKFESITTYIYISFLYFQHMKHITYYVIINGRDTMN